MVIESSYDLAGPQALLIENESPNQVARLEKGTVHGQYHSVFYAYLQSPEMLFKRIPFALRPSILDIMGAF